LNRALTALASRLHSWPLASVLRISPAWPRVVRNNPHRHHYATEPRPIATALPSCAPLIPTGTTIPVSWHPAR
jgi:hypothetical protein